MGHNVCVCGETEVRAVHRGEQENFVLPHVDVLLFEGLRRQRPKWPMHSAVSGESHPDLRRILRSNNPAYIFRCATVQFTGATNSIATHECVWKYAGPASVVSCTWMLPCWLVIWLGVGSELDLYGWLVVMDKYLSVFLSVVIVRCCLSNWLCSYKVRNAAVD